MMVIVRKLALFSIIGLAVLIGIGTLPLTRHAAQSHAGQYSVSTIIPLFQDGGCKPKSAYICAGEQLGFALCGIKPHENIWGGIVVGWRDGVTQVITGYASRMDYWTANLARRSCVRVPYWLFGAALVVMPVVCRLLKGKK